MKLKYNGCGTSLTVCVEGFFCCLQTVHSYSVKLLSLSLERLCCLHKCTPSVCFTFENSTAATVPLRRFHGYSTSTMIPQLQYPCDNFKATVPFWLLHQSCVVDHNFVPDLPLWNGVRTVVVWLCGNTPDYPTIEEIHYDNSTAILWHDSVDTLWPFCGYPFDDSADILW